jgi:hydroxyacylglutathione hydrolase
MKVFDGLYAFIWRDYQENNCNTYLIVGKMKILIDPGHQHLFKHVHNKLNAMNIRPDQIDVAIITHGHPDHLEAVAGLDKSTMFAMSTDEHRFISDLAGKYFKIPEPYFFLQEGDLTIGDHHFQVIVTPGHSPGSICLYWPDKKAMFTGDVVFNQGIGRSDLPGGDSGKLKTSIKKIADMDIDYLLTGHGDIVAGKDAVQANFQNIVNHWFRYL